MFGGRRSSLCIVAEKLKREAVILIHFTVEQPYGILSPSVQWLDEAFFRMAYG
jgi:hypothetical protein